MKKLIFILLFIPMLLFAGEQFMIQSGEAFVKDGNSWKEVKMKMKLNETDTIKVVAGEEVKLVTFNGTIYSVRGEKEILLKTLLETKNEERSLLEKLFIKLGKKVDGNNDGPTAVAGVRGADIYKQSQRILAKELYWEE